MSPLQDFLKGSKAIAILNVSIIKDLGNNMFIISDDKNTFAVLLIDDVNNIEKLLKAGQGIKIIKPEQIKENILKPYFDSRFNLASLFPSRLVIRI